MANTLKFVCACKTVVMEAATDTPMVIAVHGKVDVTCTVCGAKYEYMHGTGGKVAIADNGGITVSQ
jgi:redox-regulated HSP33 family molecular chaperone